MCMSFKMWNLQHFIATSAMPDEVISKGRFQQQKSIKKWTGGSLGGGGILQNREAVHFFVLLFLVPYMFLLLTVIILFVRAKLFICWFLILVTI